jgi:hypothetical protein
MVGRFSGRDIIVQPTCPFCGADIERPKELETRRPGEMPVGTCSCGAVYACDVTGHNLGTAMIEALVFSCDGDWDLAWNLLPEEDYLEEQVTNYDYESHRIVQGSAYGGRHTRGTLFFIKPHEDIREVTEEGVRKKIKRAHPPASGRPTGKRDKKAFTKKEVETLVRDYKIDALLTLAAQDHRIIRDLKRLLYSVDNQMRLRAAESLGRVSVVVAQTEPGTISKLLQGFFTEVSDTAASSWGALDAVGEIIRHSPEQFAGYIPQLYPYLRDRALLADVLRVLGRIGDVRPDLLQKIAHRFVPLLRDPDPSIRGYAIMLLGNLGTGEARADLSGLVDDSEELEVYSAGEMETWTISRLATEALKKI